MVFEAGSTLLDVERTAKLVPVGLIVLLELVSFTLDHDTKLIAVCEN